MCFVWLLLESCFLQHNTLNMMILSNICNMAPQTCWVPARLAQPAATRASQYLADQPCNSHMLCFDDQPEKWSFTVGRVKAGQPEAHSELTPSQPYRLTCCTTHASSDPRMNVASSHSLLGVSCLTCDLAGAQVASSKYTSRSARLRLLMTTLSLHSMTRYSHHSSCRCRLPKLQVCSRTACS